MTNERQVTNGDSINVHYTGKLDDGTVFDTSHYRGMTLNFNVGTGRTIDGFDEAVLGMTCGEKRTVTIPHDRAYGPRIDEAVQQVDASFFPEDFQFVEGAIVHGMTDNGQEIIAKLLAQTENGYLVDFNHPLAGMDLTFEIEMVSFGETEETATA